ncbi:hypothetical protein [Occallatibacter riparius]|uniref:Uncharacterized protein n=1 Tax=Occallatibacter riparius TaxID=1002689 RepID=A0A9J7BI03_9BACT|nr:hypothetical protein [Occallatibacter riparius]UWZ82343.1 hypothetical protein MOP44_17410 [Occallatibacter riparius]
MRSSSADPKRLSSDTRLQLVTLMLAILCVFNTHSAAAQETAACHAAPAASLAGWICHSSEKEIHIFYIHGIGNDGPTDFDSLELRKSICAYLKDCTTPAGEPVGPWDYADEGYFAPGAAPPALDFLGQPVWRNNEEWSAAAPYAAHYKIARTHGPVIYVDALHWWPLTFALKCRQIVAGDASFVAPNKLRINTCSKREAAPGVPDRFRSYDWISPDDAKALLKMPSHGARANRDLKTGLMDWGFSDAVMALGPLRPYILDGIRQLILKSLSDAHPENRSESAPVAENDEFTIVSHSLGSYLIFAALDTSEDTTGDQAIGHGERFHEVLERTSRVYFFANQLRLLELASLDGRTDRNLVTHLEVWAKLRCDHLKTQPNAPQECAPPRITALNDPSDLLTWTVPDLEGVKVENWTVKNAPHWLGIIENPTLAHNNYARDKRAVKAILAGDGPK